MLNKLHTDLTDTGFTYQNKPVWIKGAYLKSVPRPDIYKRNSIKESIEQDGLHEKIILNESNIVLDGHTRIEICKELHIQPEFVVKHFQTEAEERKFVIVVNLKRRHLNILQNVELSMNLHEQIKHDVIVKQKSNITKTKSKKQRAIGSLQESTTNAIFGKEIGISRSSVDKALFILKNGTESLIDEVRTGKKSLHEGYNEVNTGIVKVRVQKKKKEVVHMNKIKKKTYRSTLGIMYSILDGLQVNGNTMLISVITRSCNLSHYAALEKCNSMEKNGMLKTIIKDRNRMYVITDKGLSFKRDFDIFVDRLKAIGLDKEL